MNLIYFLRWLLSENILSAKPLMGLFLIFSAFGIINCAGGRGGFSNDNKIRFLLPQPHHILEKKDQKFLITPSTLIILDENLDESEKVCGNLIREALEEMCPEPLHIVFEKISPDMKGIIIGNSANPAIKKMAGGHNLSISPEMELEGYILDSNSERIIIAASSAAGRFYGVQTFIQLLTTDKRQLVVPGVYIRDWSETTIRGIVDDISHGQVSTQKDFARIIKTLARYKLNTYFLYIEDMFTPLQYPSIGTNSGALSARMIQSLQEQAAPYHVSIVPIFPWPGNMEKILAIPEYAGMGVFPGATCFNISNPETTTFLKNIITEMAETFNGKYFILDGSHDIGDLESWAKSENLSRTEIRKLYIRHVELVDSIVQSFGKKVCFSMPASFGDISTELPAGMGIFYYVNDINSLPEPVSGRPVIISPDLEKRQRNIPDYLYFFQLLSKSVKWAAEHDASGVTAVFRHRSEKEYFRENGWFGYLSGAAEFWHPGSIEKGLVIPAILFHHYGYYHARLEQTLREFWTLNLTPPEGWITHREFWKPPFTRSYTFEELKFLDELSESLRTIQRQVRTFRRDNEKLSENLTYTAFAIDQERWAAKKINYIKKIIEIENILEKGKGLKGTTTEAVSLVSDLIRDLFNLRDEFQRLWERTNKKEGIDFYLQRFNDQISVLERKMKDIKANRRHKSPLVKAHWIWHNPASTIRKDNKWSFFRKTFSAREKLEEMFIQVQCMPYGRVYINGQYIGEVATRMYNSPILLSETVKVFNVTPYVRSGENIIAVEMLSVPSGSGSVPAGINIFGEIRYQDYSEDTLQTDFSWKASREEFPEWRTPSFDDSLWQTVNVLGAQPPVQKLEWIMPNINRIPHR